MSITGQKMSDLAEMVDGGNVVVRDTALTCISAWAEMLEEVCERLNTLQPGANKTEQCATVRAVAVEWGFEIHPTAGVCFDKSKVQL